MINFLYKLKNYIKINYNEYDKWNIRLSSINNNILKTYIAINIKLFKDLSVL